MQWMLAAVMILGGMAPEAIEAPMPTGFKVGYQAAQGGQSIEERVPAAETVETWSRMVTVQRFAGMADLGAHGLLDRLGGMMARSCAGAKVGPIADGSENAHAVATMRVDCPLNGQTGKPETMFARAFQGGADLHLVQYAYRAIPSAEQSAIAERYLAGVRLRTTD